MDLRSTDLFQHDQKEIQGSEESVQGIHHTESQACSRVLVVGRSRFHAVHLTCTQSGFRRIQTDREGEDRDSSVG